VTGKAFPEDEAVVTVSAADDGEGEVLTTFEYERRIGALNQIEIEVPFAAAETSSGSWAAGLGDLTLGFKRTLAHSLARGAIFSPSSRRGKKAGGLAVGQWSSSPSWRSD
jgi:hypothetical protein